MDVNVLYDRVVGYETNECEYERDRDCFLFGCWSLLCCCLVPMGRLTINLFVVTLYDDEFKYNGSVTLPLYLHIAGVTGLIFLAQ